MDVQLVEEYNRYAVASIDGDYVKNTPSPESRTIFKHKGLIVKFDSKFFRGYSSSQCNTEVKMWNEIIEDEDRKYFQPIVASGKNWIAQEIIQFHPDIFNSEAWKIIKLIAKKYDLIDIQENKNWGMRLDGSPIIYDYGV
jgi:hypothetical protein